MNQSEHSGILSGEVVERVHCELSSVVVRLAAAHALAMQGVCEIEQRESVLEAIAAICESAGRVLDECGVRLGGTRTSNFYEPLKHWGEA